MLIYGGAVVTNITKETVRVVGSLIKRPRVQGAVWVKSQLSDVYHSNAVDIPARAIADITFHFQVAPPFKKPGRNFSSQIALVDQYGNRHWQRFKFRFQDVPKA